MRLCASDERKTGRARVALALVGALGVVALLAPAPAQARKLLLTCQDSKQKYQITYDTLARTLTTTHKEFYQKLDVERVQEEAEGVLVWGAMRLGSATRNILVHFGKQKWVRHFRGYDETLTDSCI
jgi:hypothetical protein